MPQTLTPRLAAPVERTLPTASATAADGLTPSLFAGVTWKDIPFAGDGHE
ncbi:anacyclamide/piricyclamide family prenylated cyclic peptide [Nonomuraea sp. FMUSA5-5]|uniref:Anacyclamide/piricyclamide family prenylated cyclic peptide n=1 Tax=Nonomuraea composti TaxID=2720023 RepID=A0ABX1BCL8_9ACTN|nr:anacyclamide/piricyclamide family prenylated cyclic peptide [Nonomuraea sp. FMUSA5-5]NJP92883.1 anacyclamide/piricyclamide family prenylated cyclic peptide [Nonomuraea sp. FMUSA5-5]